MKFTRTSLSLTFVALLIALPGFAADALYNCQSGIPDRSVRSISIMQQKARDGARAFLLLKVLLVGFRHEAVLLADELGPRGCALGAAALGPAGQHDIVERLVAHFDVLG